MQTMGSFWLIFVEGGIEHHRHTGALEESVDQAVVAAVVGFSDGLQATTAIPMGYGRD